MEGSKGPLRVDRNFQKIKSSINKQTKSREVADEEVTYVDSNRNISVALGEEDLKQDLTEQGLSKELIQDGPSKSLFHNEVAYHSKKGNLNHAIECAAMAQELLDGTDYEILTTQAGLQFHAGEYKEALKTAGTFLQNKKDSWKAIFIKAECFYNLCDFEHALIMYHKGNLTKQYMDIKAIK
jgi:tetratricopeptide (TPR) repeat protein